MSESTFERLRSAHDRVQGADDRLRGLLGRWAQANRLSRPQIQALRQAIVTEPAPADFEWWWRLLNPDGGTAFQGLPTAPAWETPSMPVGISVQPTTFWPLDAPTLPVWDHDEIDFQPYLRLT
jgi:hypothetical protein